jgi:hypothetical protein
MTTINALLMDASLIMVVLIQMWNVMILILVPWIIVRKIMVVGMMLTSARKGTLVKLYPVSKTSVVSMRIYLVMIMMSVLKILVMLMHTETALVFINL